MQGVAMAKGGAKRDTGAEWAKARGARAVNIRAPLGDDGRLVRAATYRLDGATVIERMAAAGQLNERQRQNAAALLAVWKASGLAPSVVASYRASAGRGGRRGDRDAEADWHRVMREVGPAGWLLRAMVAEDAHPGWRTPDARAALDGLDWLAAEWDGEQWHEDA